MWLRGNFAHIIPRPGRLSRNPSSFALFPLSPNQTSENMLTRFDSISSVSESTQPGSSGSDNMGPVIGRKLSRTGTEMLNEAYKHFSAISPTLAPRAEPSLSQIVRDLDEYRDAYADDEDWPQDEDMPPPTTRSSSHAVVSAEPSNSTRGTNASTAAGAFVPQPLRSFPSLSQPMEQWFNEPSSLENAPPPDFSMPPSSTTTLSCIPEDTPMETDEEDREPTPFPLSQLIDFREVTPTPETAPQENHAALRRFSTIPAPQAQPLVPHTPVRGASTSNMGGDMTSPSTAVRRSRRVQEKIDELRAKNEIVKGIYAPSPSPRRQRKN
ncbi:hypothetical protein OH77DRAFT_1590579 [Trametes cingulata]|nr:hypothetical protein OH77DRAFT_1590579 [Trametes cingulata]